MLKKTNGLGPKEFMLGVSAWVGRVGATAVLIGVGGAGSLSGAAVACADASAADTATDAASVSDHHPTDRATHRTRSQHEGVRTATPAGAARRPPALPRIEQAANQAGGTTAPTAGRPNSPVPAAVSARRRVVPVITADVADSPPRPLTATTVDAPPTLATPAAAIPPSAIGRQIRGALAAAATIPGLRAAQVAPAAGQLTALSMTGNPLSQLNFALHQSLQVAATVVQAALESAAAAIRRLLGFNGPTQPALTGVGSPVIPTFVDARGTVTGSPDPFITYSEGTYHATYTSWDHIEIRSAPSIALLSIATPTVVFPSPDTPPPADHSAHIWAPELHLLNDPADGKQHWYLYYTAESPKSSFFTGHRVFVLESQSDTPLGPYGPAGVQLDTKTASLTIDPTVYQAPDGRQYLFFAAYPSSSSTGTENLYVQALKNPTTTEGDPIVISTPAFDWERRGLVPGGGINEAPEVFVDGNTLNVVYSGGTYFVPAGYSLGNLSVPADANLLDPQTWVNAKQPNPLLTTSPATGVWSPGHNSFFTSPDGSQTWIAYHAYTNPLQGLPALLAILGFNSPEYRTTRIQQVSTTSAGTPVFGAPGAVTVQTPAPSGDPGLTSQFEGAPATTHQALTVSRGGAAYVGGAGVRVLLGPNGSATFTVPAPDGTYHLYLRQVPNAYGGQYNVSIDGRATVAVDSNTLGVDLGTVTASGGTITVALRANKVTIADLDEVILIRGETR